MTVSLGEVNDVEACMYRRRFQPASCKTSGKGTSKMVNKASVSQSISPRPRPTKKRERDERKRHRPLQIVKRDDEEESR